MAVMGSVSMPGDGTILSTRRTIPFTVEERRQQSLRDAALAAYERHQLTLRSRQRRVKRRPDEEGGDDEAPVEPSGIGMPIGSSDMLTSAMDIGPIIDIKPVPASIVQCVIPAQARLLPPLVAHCEHYQVFYC